MPDGCPSRPGNESQSRRQINVFSARSRPVSGSTGTPVRFARKLGGPSAFMRAIPLCRAPEDWRSWPLGRGNRATGRRSRPATAFNEVLLHVAQNENDPCRVIAIRPSRQPQRRMKDMLNALDDDRPRRIVGQRHDPLDAQEIGTVRAGAAAPGKDRAPRRHRHLVADAKGADAGVVTVDVQISAAARVMVAMAVLIRFPGRGRLPRSAIAARRVFSGPDRRSRH